MDVFQKIKLVGKSRICSDKDLFLFLPNYPVLRGSEFIFSISWANAKKYIDDEVEYFVEGLHLIEERYKTKAGTDFGFGSPSPSFKVIQKLAEEDYEKSLELEKWIALNEGNFYITKVSESEEFQSKLGKKSLF